MAFVPRCARRRRLLHLLIDTLIVATALGGAGAALAAFVVAWPA